MTLSICGSATFLKEMVELQTQLEVFGFEVHTPMENDQSVSENEAGYSEEAVRIKLHTDAIRKYEKLIRESEGIVVANYAKNGIQGYIGGNVLMEMGYAFAGNKDIFLLNPIPDAPYRAEIEAMQPIILNGDLHKIQEYYQNLPVVYIGSENVQKIHGVLLGFRQLNKRVQVRGLKTNSGIMEQPTTVDDAYTGAQNRLIDLKRMVRPNEYEFLVSIEGGATRIHRDHNPFSFDVCMIENTLGVRKVAINTFLEYPKEMTDLVPSMYPDLGTMAQQKYGQKNKDPFPVFTYNRISRLDLLKTVVTNTLALFE